MLYWCAVTTQIFHVFIGIKISWLDLISLSSLSIIIPPTHPQKNIVSMWLENMQPLIQVHWKLCVCFGLSVVVVFLIVGEGVGWGEEGM